ncbi:MAG: histidine kinase [Sphingomonas bacterium]|uniref:ATP-binding protein n=1 Tax=Sphingomonas bacterium TaxID=1895847 RepID=UPI002638C9AE|nr:ATP-binding protein [Sphingomonas bacterium]MDB5706161.1 histidine kinase [Sphingomonas bacterium]
MQAPDHGAERVLVFAPIGRDGRATAELLQRGSIDAKLCADLAELVRGLEAGAAAAFIAEEGLFGADTDALFAWAGAQPPWSDLPFVILTSHQELPAVTAWRRRLVAALRTVALLERPVQAITLTSAIQAALRARRRQYEVRALLQARERAAVDLEAQIIARTRELETANGELRTQIEERARVEESLRQAQKIEAIGQLTGGIAHDFNNLLMVILGGLDMVDRQTDPARRKRLMEGMRQAAQRGAGLTKQLLAFSRRQELKPEPVDLRRQIGGMQELLDRSLRGDVHVRFEFADDVWPVAVDPGELELVMLNLAVNARDAMPNGGTIVVRARNAPGNGTPGDDLVRLSVTDTGTGMSREIQARVFEPFFTTKDIGKGSGLGLAQVHGFAEQSGGSIEIDSAIGRGTTITLVLPRSSQAPGPDEHHLVDLNIARPGPGKTGSILLVEDDDEVAALVGEMLDQLGYEVTRAASATAALGALANGRAIDILFSDVMMPGGMNGVELAREAHARRPTLPILLTSGFAQAAARAAAEEGVKILPKPYRIEELAAALQQATSPVDDRDGENSPAH